MRVFITNDDGIHSPGVAVLARHLDAVASRVVVGAPHEDHSGAGTSVRSGRFSSGVEMKPHSLPGAEHVEAHAVVGPPALTVIMAHFEAFGPRPAVVVSGPHVGPNLGRDIHHSGTVGAALTAVKYGIHGVAVSQALNSSEPHWDSSARIAAAVAEGLHSARLDRAALVNLNVPDLPLEEIKGIRTVALARHANLRVTGFTREPQADGGMLIRPTIEWHEGAGDVETDTGALAAGYATITWLSPVEGEPAPPLDPPSIRTLLRAADRSVPSAAPHA